MFKKFKELWINMSEVGAKLPFLYDPTSGMPSITLGLLYLTSLFMFGSMFALHFKVELLSATTVAVIVWCLSYVFYRMRKIDKMKVDVDDGSFELDSEDEEEKPK